MLSVCLLLFYTEKREKEGMELVGWEGGESGRSCGRGCHYHNILHGKIFAIKTRTRILLLGPEALFERKDISHTHQPSKVGANQLHNAVLWAPHPCCGRYTPAHISNTHTFSHTLTHTFSHTLTHTHKHVNIFKTL